MSKRTKKGSPRQSSKESSYYFGGLKKKSGLTSKPAKVYGDASAIPYDKIGVLIASTPT